MEVFMADNVGTSKVKEVSKTEKVRQMVEADIPGEVLYTLEKGGKEFTYIPGWYVKQQANTIFGLGNWAYTCNWEQMKHIPLGNSSSGKMRGMYTVPVTMKIKIENEWVEFSDIGVGEYTGENNKETGLKGCVTDGLKRCMSNLGKRFGLELYKEDQEDQQNSKNSVRRGSQTSSNAGSGASSPTMKPNQVIPTCKDCGSDMALKKGRYGEFWGCTNYPTCKTTYQTSEVGVDGTYTPKRQEVHDKNMSENVDVDDLPF
jgi:DNA repair and recombination protein RAD52